MSGTERWGGDDLPGGLTPDDRIGWEIAGTVVIRYVPDPETGVKRGLSTEFHGEIPKVILAHQLLALAQDLMTHCDFQDGIPLTCRHPEGEHGEMEGEGDG